jgi:hypothetical protein
VADLIAECTPYFYPPSAQYEHEFPTVWELAQLLSGDSEGHALWSNIEGRIPNIPLKGQLDNSTAGVNYDSKNDPDCCE